ncbi:hypothetical protein EU92_0136 [Prochlorococcus marinus str. MIT 9107]|uniref:Uncharacterized protein n=1 Tax=Prochlorococcus marinus str. MIT 9116 TaxID=167544 RepID=A0A0A1ZXZ4_PROMR|nr:hypothetical protein EU92_0136 [Prochlorococcus marinus str. MIT 9107]KGF93466.1 hypothetical protein EU93_0095 [Prochlorococcus marinus str. MIT 9116]KGF94121.1 hypothetical protein EU94_1027 [Prochlorococcus marinus str. MIT 9123]
MRKDIYSNIKDSEALQSFFEFITLISVVRELIAQQHVM